MGDYGMKMEQIEHVLAISAAGSISKAAQQLFLSQPNLSTSLKNLEAELGEKIFDRCGKGVVLTDFGHEFISFAEPAVGNFRLLGDFCENAKQRGAQSLLVASQYLRFANSVFIRLYAKYKKDNVRFSFLEGSFHNVVQRVNRQDAEIGLVVLSKLQKRMMLQLFKGQGLEYHALVEACPAVIIGRKNPLFYSKEEQVTAENLREYPVVTYRDENYSFAPVWVQLSFADPQNRIMVSDRATMYEIIGSTEAYTVATHINRAYEQTNYYENIRALTVSGKGARLEIGCISRASFPLSSMAAEYVAELCRVIG